jgi:hypothetical protein
MHFDSNEMFFISVEKFSQLNTESNLFNDEALSTEHLEKTYGPMQAAVTDSISRQDELIAKITVRTKPYRFDHYAHVPTLHFCIPMLHSSLHFNHRYFLTHSFFSALTMSLYNRRLVQHRTHGQK